MFCYEPIVVAERREGATAGWGVCTMPVSHLRETGIKEIRRRRGEGIKVTFSLN